MSISLGSDTHDQDSWLPMFFLWWTNAQKVQAPRQRA